MRDLGMFYRRLWIVLFINIRFSNARQEKITNPSETFAYTASIHSLFVREPNQPDLTHYVSTTQMFLAVHTDYVTLSIYQSDAPYTFFTFEQRHVHFEILYAETMIFSVQEENQTWYFQCVMSADKDTFDIVYSYLSLRSAQGLMEFRMYVSKVESYVKTKDMRDPFIEAVDGLQPGILCDQQIVVGDSSNKIFSITQSTFDETERIISRLVFRTGNFEVRQVESIVVLKLKTCNSWYYIFYFQKFVQATKFIQFLGTPQSLVLPMDLKSYAETRSLYALLTSRTESESESDETPPEVPSQFRQTAQTSSRENSPGKRSGPEEDPRLIIRKWGKTNRRTAFTPGQITRLQREFEKQHFLDDEQCQTLVTELGLPESSIRIWFQNKRARTKKGLQNIGG